jgi:peptide/nickel transport system substrate-binding protein
MKKGIVFVVLVSLVLACLPALVMAEYKEAPMLAEMVKAGKLPPVEERLPKNPRVIQVFEEIGKYGGNWRRAYKGVGDRWGPANLVAENTVLYVVQADGSQKLEPNWIDQITSNEDATEWTMHIREGLRWSDGELVTTDDVRFWYEDYVLREDLFGSPPFDVFQPGGEMMQLEIVDELTFIAKFANPYPSFPAILTGYTQSPMLPVIAFLIPEHYMRNYHPDYAPEGFLDKVVAEYGVKDWKSLWGDRGPIASWWLNPDLPTITPWIATKAVPPDPQIKFVRNPYYFAVDPEGNQLPYIDTITHDLFQDVETLNLWVVQGLIDMQARHIDAMGNYPLFKENEEKGGYVLKHWMDPSNHVLIFNQNYPEENYRNLFQDIRFREAMSVAIDREEIVDITLNGLAEPRQASPPSGSPEYDAEFETKWAEYDPDRANTLLDELGLTQRDKDGFRMFSDGKELKLIFTISTVDKAAELITSYWKAVGINTFPNPVERSLRESMAANNELMVTPAGFGGLRIVSSADARFYTSVDTNDRGWAPLWARWYASGGTRGEEPPADHPIRKIWAAWDAAQTSATLEEAQEHIKKMVQIHKENVWVIGVFGERAAIFVVNKKMGNVPEGLPGSVYEVLGRPAQFFFKE